MPLNLLSILNGATSNWSECFKKENPQAALDFIRSVKPLAQGLLPEQIAAKNSQDLELLEALFRLKDELSKPQDQINFAQVLSGEKDAEVVINKGIDQLIDEAFKTAHEEDSKKIPEAERANFESLKNNLFAYRNINSPQLLQLYLQFLLRANFFEEKEVEKAFLFSAFHGQIENCVGGMINMLHQYVGGGLIEDLVENIKRETLEDYYNDGDGSYEKHLPAFIRKIFGQEIGDDLAINTSYYITSTRFLEELGKEIVSGDVFKRLFRANLEEFFVQAIAEIKKRELEPKAEAQDYEEEYFLPRVKSENLERLKKNFANQLRQEFGSEIDEMNLEFIAIPDITKDETLIAEELAERSLIESEKQLEEGLKSFFDQQINTAIREAIENLIDIEDTTISKFFRDAASKSGAQPKLTAIEIQKNPEPHLKIILDVLGEKLANLKREKGDAFFSEKELKEKIGQIQGLKNKTDKIQEKRAKILMDETQKSNLENIGKLYTDLLKGDTYFTNEEFLEKLCTTKSGIPAILIMTENHLAINDELPESALIPENIKLYLSEKLTRIAIAIDDTNSYKLTLLGNEDDSYPAKLVRSLKTNDLMSLIYLSPQVLSALGTLEVNQDWLENLFHLSNQTEFFVRYFQLFFQKERSADEIKLAAAKLTVVNANDLDLATSNLMKLINHLNEDQIYQILASKNGLKIYKISPEKFVEALGKIENEEYIYEVLTSDSGKVLAGKSPEKFAEVLGNVRVEDNISKVLQSTSGKILAEKLPDKFIEALRKFENKDSIFEVLNSDSGEILAENSPDKLLEALAKFQTYAPWIEKYDKSRKIIAENSPEKFAFHSEDCVALILQSNSGKILAENSPEKFIEALGKFEREGYIFEVLSSNSGKILAEKSPDKFGKALATITNQDLISKVESSEAGKIFLSKKPEAAPENPKAEKAEKEDGKTTTGQR